MRRHGLLVEMRATAGPRDAGRLAEETGPETDMVVAVGGDGTINEIANGLAQRAARERAAGRSWQPLLGIVPAGTVNVLALELGIPFQVEKACRVIAAGNTLSLDLGKVNDRRFTLMMGVGIDALTIHNLDLEAKRRFHEWAFVSTGLRTGFADSPAQFLVRVDGKEYRSTFFVAGNTHYYGGRFGVTPKADPTDGMLDLMIFQGTTRTSLAVFWLEVPTALHLQNHNAVFLRAAKAELLPLTEDKAMWFQTDGELAGRLPATVEIEPHALDVLVPVRTHGRRSWHGKASAATSDTHTRSRVHASTESTSSPIDE